VKKILAAFIILLFVVGCAPKTIPLFVPDPDIKARAAALFLRVNEEMNVPVNPYLRNAAGVNAWIDDNSNMNMTLGMFRYDDATVTFIMAHEMAHLKLNHIENRKAISGAVTLGLIVANVFVPGAGIFNQAVNPAVTCAYSRSKELEADKEAAEACVRLGIPIVKIVDIMNDLRKVSADGGNFWDQHPSWDDRIENIQTVPQ
jgi:Zn-dependent protease with chaperone function